MRVSFQFDSSCSTLLFFPCFLFFYQVQVCNKVPSFHKLLKGKQIVSQEVWEILDWSLDRTFALKSVDKSKVMLCITMYKPLICKINNSQFGI